MKYNYYINRDFIIFNNKESIFYSATLRTFSVRGAAQTTFHFVVSFLLLALNYAIVFKFSFNLPCFNNLKKNQSVEIIFLPSLFLSLS